MAKQIVGPLYLVAAMGFSSMALAVATADTQVPSGPYSSWTYDEKVQTAKVLNQNSTAACQTYLNNATTSRGAQFEALACVAAYYVNHVPADYPNLTSLKSTAIDAYKSARAAGVNAPSFLASPPPP